MICPKCHQPVQVKLGGCCPLCGFALAGYMQHLQKVYAVNFAFFASTLVYSGLVYFLETREVLHPSAVPVQLPYVFLVVAVLLLGLARRVGRPLEQLPTMPGVLSWFITRLALVEAVAVFGLLAFFLTVKLYWFVTFLALSWVGFLIVGSQMPRVAQRLAELAVEEERK
jgi:hypothetical protein